jgi:hypothetical protein
MSQPVKVSDELLLDARVTGAVLKRSIAGQIEFWASLGRAIEPLLHGDAVIALARSGTVQPLSTLLATVDTAKGRARVLKHLSKGPYPHYEAHPKRPGLLSRIDASGKRTTGRFVDRKFRPVKQKPA